MATLLFGCSLDGFRRREDSGDDESDCGRDILTGCKAVIRSDEKKRRPEMQPTRVRRRQNNFTMSFANLFFSADFESGRELVFVTAAQKVDFDFDFDVPSSFKT